MHKKLQSPNLLKIVIHAPYSMQTPGMHPDILSPKLPLLSIKSNFFTSPVDSSAKKISRNSDFSRFPFPQTRTGKPQETPSTLLLISPSLIDTPHKQTPGFPRLNFLLQKGSLPLATGFQTAFALLAKRREEEGSGEILHLGWGVGAGEGWDSKIKFIAPCPGKRCLLQ